MKTVKLQKTGQDLWTATVKGDLKDRFYTFDMGRGECPGVFAKAVGVNGRKGCILDLKDTDPEGWTEDRRPVTKSPADLVIYEMHHRDFSIARKDAAHPGKFLALTEPWAISHLKELGVNAIHILPSYDYGSVDETRLADNKYNWGYDPVNYNVPEGSYSTDPYQPEVRIREFKQAYASSSTWYITIPTTSSTPTSSAPIPTISTARRQTGNIATAPAVATRRLPTSQ